jgi:preprotein translocase subunit YajC
MRFRSLPQSALAATATLAAATPAFALGQRPGKEGEGGPAGGLGGLILPLLVTFAIFYFLLVRPQQRQARDRKTMLDAVKKGDNVVTSGGIHGKVTGITESVATLEVAEVSGQKVRLKVDRDQIARVEKEVQA